MVMLALLAGDGCCAAGAAACGGREVAFWTPVSLARSAGTAAAVRFCLRFSPCRG